MAKKEEYCRMRARSKKTRKHRQKGGDTKAHACGMPYEQGEPPAKCVGEELEGDQIERLKKTLAYIPDDISIFVLKIGSNDDPAVVGHTYNNANRKVRGFSSGSKGRKEGFHYLEIPVNGKFDAPVGTDSKFYDLKMMPQSLARRYVAFINSLIVSEEKNGYLLNVTPTTKHVDFEYPFGQEKPDGMQTLIYNTIADKIDKTIHLENFFPLTYSGKNKEVLDMIVKRPELLVLYNAMTGSCHTSMKYIIDMRTHEGKKTIYMGLADKLNDRVECDILHPIYPNRKESCEGILDAGKEHEVAIKCGFGKKNNKNTTNKKNNKKPTN